VKICIIGNSHIAALQHALREGRFARRGIDFDFWGLPNKQFEEIKYDQGILVTTNLRKLKALFGARHGRLKIGAYDALVFHGGPLRLDRLLIAIKAAGEGFDEFDEEFLAAGIESFLSGLNAIRLVSEISDSHALPIVVSADPLPARRRNGRRKNPEIAAEDLERLQMIVGRLIEARKAMYLRQDAGTIEDAFYTRGMFAENAKRFKNDGMMTKEGDIKHMNSRYGEIVLGRIADLLAGAA